MTLRIGITGPIGCGKSTVASWLADLGAVVIDADLVAREVTAPGSAELAAVLDAFGGHLLRVDGTLDRPALGRIVFNDPAALRRLESIVHPAVRRRIVAQLADAEAAGDTVLGGPAAVVIEAIKLVEGGLAALCDEVWLVTCDAAVQRQRLIERNRGRNDQPDAAVDAAAEADASGAVDAATATGPADAEADAVAAAEAAAEAAVGAAAAEADANARIAAQGDLAARVGPAASRVIDTSGSVAESRSHVQAAWEAAVSRVGSTTGGRDP